jgi:hypothetical protein
LRKRLTLFDILYGIVVETLIPRFLKNFNINIETLYKNLKIDVLQRYKAINLLLLQKTKNLKKLKNKILNQKNQKKFSAEVFFKKDSDSWKYINFPREIKLLQQIRSTLRFVLPAKLADTGPPTGPMLGQYNVPLADFCQLF